MASAVAVYAYQNVKHSAAYKPSMLLGRELFVLIVFGQSRPSSSKCIQLHAFFIFRKSLEVSARTRANARRVSLLFFT